MERELAETTEGTDGLGGELKSTGDEAEKSGGKFEKLGGVLKGVGVAMGAMVVAVGAAAIKLGKDVVQQFGLTEKNIICHSEGYKLGIASNHGDVMHWFPHGKTMDMFREDVGKPLSLYFD